MAGLFQTLFGLFSRRRASVREPVATRFALSHKMSFMQDMRHEVSFGTDMTHTVSFDSDLTHDITIRKRG